MSNMEEQSESKPTLTFNQSVAGPVLIISFSGLASRHCASVLEQCLAEAVPKPVRFVVLSFKDVQTMERPLVPHFVKFQKQLRDSGRELRILHMNSGLQELLTGLAAVRPQEIKRDVAEAVGSFKK